MNLSSADLMARTFERRFEVMIPVRGSVKQLLEAVLDLQLQDTQLRYEFTFDGHYQKVTTYGSERLLDSQISMQECLNRIRNNLFLRV